MALNTASDSLVRDLIKCMNFCAIKHKNQRRKDFERTPYINHPIGVAHIISEEGGIYDPVVLMGALLHDTVEDTDTSLEEIEHEFGPKVRSIVEEATDDKSLTAVERKKRQVENAPNSSYEAKLVKLADKLYNLRDLKRSKPIGWSQERVTEYFLWSQRVVNGLRGTNKNLEDKLDEIFKEFLNR